MSKEKILLAVVIAAVAGLAAMDTGYDPVKPPSSKAPGDVPPAPAGVDPFARSPRPAGRSMFDPYSDLVAPPYAELPELPVPPVPLAVPPVRPWIHPDAAGSLRHLFFEPAEPPAKVEVAEEPPPEEGDEGGIAAGPGADGGAPGEGEEKKSEPKPVDLAQFDWVLPVEGLGQRLYGRIDLLPADAEAKKAKHLLLVDSSMDFLFDQVNPKDGKFFKAPTPFRHRTQELGFSDTFENNYASRRTRMVFAAGRQTLDIPQLRELVAWCMEEARKPKYSRREAWGKAAENQREILQRNPDDKDTLKELGRVLRLLQDMEGEAQLYDWWLSSQAIAKDPEILALSGEARELLGLKDRARTLYEECLVTLSDPRVRLRLAELLLATGGLEDARRAGEAFARASQDGERTAGAVGEARAFLALGDVARAEKILAERIPPADRDASWHNATGAVAYARGRLEEARGHFQAALEKSRPGEETFPVARTNLAMARARLGALLPEDDASRRTALEDAVKTAEEALKDDPLNYYWPLVAKAYAQRALAEKDAAVETLQEAVAAWPQEPYGRYLLGEFLLRDGRAAEGRTQMVECSRLSPRFPDGLGGVGRCGGGEAGEAREYLRRAMELEPNTAIWPLLAARMAILDEGLPANQRLEDARKDLTTLLEKVDRNHPFALVVLGWVRYYQGDDQESLDRWNTALRLVTGYKPSSEREREMVERILEWVKAAIQRVSKWQRTRIQRDDFRRPDGSTVGNGWNEDEKAGVKIVLKDGAAQFGPGKAAASEVPALWKPFDAARFLKGTVEIEVLPSEPVQVEILFWMPQGTQAKVATSILGLRKTEDGQTRLRIKKDQRTKLEEELQEIPGFQWPADGKVSFGFVKMNEEKGTVSLFLNGKAIAGYEALELQTFIKSKGGSIRVEVRCTASAGTEVNCRVEAVEVWLDQQ